MYKKDLTSFDKVFPMLVQKYETFLPPTDETIEDKMNSLITYLNKVGKLNNDVVKQWNNVAAWTMNDGLTTTIEDKVNILLENGDFDTIFEDILNENVLPEINVRLDETDIKVESLNTKKVNHADLFVNVKDYGAKGNGITDDSAFIQSAIDYAYANNKTVYFPFGKYLVNNSLIIPDRVSLIGANNQFTMGSNMNNCETLIVANVNKLFVGKTLGTSLVPFISRVTMKNLAFTRGSNGAIVFDLFQFTDSDISNNFFRDFDIVINGKTTNLTRIEKNYFLNVRQNAITTLNLDSSIQSITDSYIKNNYFSGSIAYTSVKHIDVKFLNFSVVSDNFFDFAYWGLHINSGQNVTISNNIFDYCFRGIRLNFLGGITIVGNHFTHINTTHASRWSTPTSEMQNTVWCGIHLRISVNGLSIEGNQGYDCQILILIDGSGYKNIKTRGNVQNIPANPVIDMKRYIDGAYTGDGTELRFEELNNRNVSVLPSTTGATIGSFDGNILFYQGKIIRNDSGIWKDAMGATVS